MRTFQDVAGTEWTVFEVRRAVSVKGDWSYLPHGYNDGWLCFESSATKKRLTRYPERWREFTDAELQALLAEAQTAPRPSPRYNEDILGGPPTDTRAE